MASLNGSVALITGAARGIGAGVARRLVEEGVKVVIGDVLDQEGEALAEELGAAAVYVHLDVTDSSSWAQAVKVADTAFGDVRLLVNNAGVHTVAPLEDTPEADIRQIYDVNLLGPFLGMQAVVPGMRAAGGGSIINVASASGLIGMPMQAAYSSSKWGLRGLAKTAAVELGRYGIRVNTIHPGVIRSALTAGLEESMFEVYAVPRIGEPADISAAVVYLASDESSFVTGADLPVDGGFILGPVPSAS